MTSAQEESLEEIVLSREQLEEIRIREENERGTGRYRLLDIYIAERGDTRNNYLRNNSEYLRSSDLNISTVISWFSEGARTFPLKHFKGLVDELGIPMGDLTFVFGGNPFEVTNEKLEEWSHERNGIKELLAFYIDLNHGLPFAVYIREKSEYVKARKINCKSFITPFYKRGISKGDLKGLVDELDIPYEQVKRVSCVDLSKVEYKEELTRTEQLKNFRKEQEENKYDKGIGMLLDRYMRDNKISRDRYLRESSKYIRDNKINAPAAASWINGRNKFPLKHMNGLADELGVDKDELEFVAGRNPFEVTEEELERWSVNKNGIGKLFRFYISLNYGTSVRQYLKNESECVEMANLIYSSVRNNWFNGNNPFPPEHLKGFAEEIGVPPDYVKRVTGVDLEEVKTTAEELDTALVGYLANE